MEGVGDVGMRSASTSSAETDVRCDMGRSSASAERRRRGSTAVEVVAEAERPLIFSARSGESGSPTWGGVLAGDDRAFICENARSSSSSPSSPSDRLSVKWV